MNILNRTIFTLTMAVCSFTVAFASPTACPNLNQPHATIPAQWNITCPDGTECMNQDSPIAFEQVSIPVAKTSMGTMVICYYNNGGGLTTKEIAKWEHNKGDWNETLDPPLGRVMKCLSDNPKACTFRKTL